MLPVAISQLVLALACGSLGVRLLLVYRRSRGLPELLLGVALLAIITSRRSDSGAWRAAAEQP
jgi:hypothetical protein